MARVAVHAEDLVVGDVVRWNDQIWRVSGSSRCGPDEVEVYFILPDESDQYTLNMRPADLLELVTSSSSRA